MLSISLFCDKGSISMGHYKGAGDFALITVCVLHIEGLGSKGNRLHIHARAWGVRPLDDACQRTFILLWAVLLWLNNTANLCMFTQLAKQLQLMLNSRVQQHSDFWSKYNVDHRHGIRKCSLYSSLLQTHKSLTKDMCVHVWTGWQSLVMASVWNSYSLWCCWDTVWDVPTLEGMLVNHLLVLICEMWWD